MTFGTLRLSKQKNLRPRKWLSTPNLSLRASAILKKLCTKLSKLKSHCTISLKGEEHMATRAMSNLEKRFVELYCGPAYMVAAKAARMLNRKPAWGTRCGRRPHVKRAIDRRLARMAMSDGEILRRMTDLGRGTIEPFLIQDEDGNPRVDLNTKNAKQNYHLVKKLKTKRRTMIRAGRGGEVEELEVSVDLELHDAKDAMIQLARIKGMYTERGPDGERLEHSFKVYVGVDPNEAI